MASFAGNVLREYQAEAVAMHPGTVDSGLIGHPGTVTYHQSWEDIPRKGGYTNKHPDDKVPPAGPQYVSASDRSKPKHLMEKNFRYYYAVFKDHTDPRRFTLAEYIGFDPNLQRARRLDYQSNTEHDSTKDHDWHEHEAFRRKYANDPIAKRNSLSIQRGETKAQFLESIGQAPKPPVKEDEEDMKLIVANHTGRATVFSGLRGVVPMMAHTKEEAIKGLVSAGAARQNYDSPEAMVEAMGTLEGKTVEETVKYIKDAG